MGIQDQPPLHNDTEKDSKFQFFFVVYAALLSQKKLKSTIFKFSFFFPKM